MRQQFRALVIVTMAGIAAVGLTGCGPPRDTIAEDDILVSEAITSVRLDNTSGGVTLHGRPGVGKVAIHRLIDYRGGRPIKATHHVDNGVLVLSGCGRGCWVNYTVEVPAGIAVTGRAFTGAISLFGVGDVNVTTSSGLIDLDEVAGAVDVQISDGNIYGQRLRGDHVHATTSNGSIELVPETPQDISATTDTGRITLTVPQGHYQVSVKTNSSKDITVPDDPTGEHRIEATTNNGPITVKLA